MRVMCADDRYQAIALEKLAHGPKRVMVGVAGSVHKALLRDTFLVKPVARSRPQYVGHEPDHWQLAKSIQLKDTPDNVTGTDRKKRDDVK